MTELTFADRRHRRYESGWFYESDLIKDEWHFVDSGEVQEMLECVRLMKSTFEKVSTDVRAAICLIDDQADEIEQLRVENDELRVALRWLADYGHMDDWGGPSKAIRNTIATRYRGAVDD